MEEAKAGSLVSIKGEKRCWVPQRLDDGRPMFGLVGKYFITKNIRNRAFGSLWAGYVAAMPHEKMYLLTVKMCIVPKDEPWYKDGEGSVSTILMDAQALMGISVQFFDTHEECQKYVDEFMLRARAKR